MSRRQAAPKPEELIQKLDDKLEAFKTEIIASLEEKSSDISKLRNEQSEGKAKNEESFSEIKEEFSKAQEENAANCKILRESHAADIAEVKDELKHSIDSLIEELRNNFETKLNKISQRVSSESSSSAGTQEQIQELLERVDDINEKMYDFEVNKRNNLIFYGIIGDQRETPAVLLNKESSKKQLRTFPYKYSGQLRAKPLIQLK